MGEVPGRVGKKAVSWPGNEIGPAKTAWLGYVQGSLPDSIYMLLDSDTQLNRHGNYEASVHRVPGWWPKPSPGRPNALMCLPA